MPESAQHTTNISVQGRINHFTDVLLVNAKQEHATVLFKMSRQAGLDGHSVGIFLIDFLAML